MVTTIRERVLPERQRRTLEELTDDLDLRSGDRSSKQSAFWSMLVLSAIIATAGVLADSTATVIGAMIIAPLSTPIMGIALGMVKRERLRAGRFVLAGALVVVVIGVGIALLAARLSRKVGARRQSAFVLWTVAVLVLLPLAANSVLVAGIHIWTERARAVAEDWVSGQPGTAVQDVEFVGGALRIDVRTPGELPSTTDLLSALEGEIPDGVPIVVDTTFGDEIEVGAVGQDPG